jgi:hypothetical protein
MKWNQAGLKKREQAKFIRPFESQRRTFLRQWESIIPRMK